MLSVFALALSVTIAVFLAWSLVGSFVHKPLPAFPRVLSEGIQEAEARRVVEKLLPFLNKGLAFTHRILSGKDVLMSVALSTGLFFASRVLATVSLLGMMYGMVVVLFTMPKVYDMHHVEIDGAMNLFREKATFVYDAYLAKVVKMIPTGAQVATPAESSTTAVGGEGKKDE